MSYRIRFTYRDGNSGLLGTEYATRTEAELEIARRANPNNCMTYTIEEVATSHPAQPAPEKPPIGVMPRRVWEEQRIRALAGAIGRAMGHSEACATMFHVAHVRDWAAEIVDLCERMWGGQ